MATTSENASPDRLDVAIGIPHGDKIFYQPWARDSVVYLMQRIRELGYSVALVERASPDIAGNRNHIVEAALEHNARWVLMIDDDMVVPADGFERLLAHGKEIISGFFCARKPPYKICCYKKSDKEFLYHPIGNWKENVVTECDAFGGAFHLVDVDVYRRLPKPWYAWTENNGEDMYFCNKAQEHGFKVWVDTGCIVGHIGDHIYTPYDHLEYVEKMKDGANDPNAVS